MLSQCVVPLSLTVYAPESLLPDGFGAEVYRSPLPPPPCVCVETSTVPPLPLGLPGLPRPVVLVPRGSLRHRAGRR